MEKTALEKIRLGIFVIIGTALLLIAAYLIGNQQNLFGDTISIFTTFKNVSGLQKGNNVRYAGINIGTVTDIEMKNDTAIRVRMVIEESMRRHIKTNAVAAIATDGLVGSMIINIVPGDGMAPLVTSGDEIQSLGRTQTADMLSTLSVTNENAALLTEDLLKITASLNNGKGTLGRLLNDTLMAKDMLQTLTNLRKASSGANTTIQELNSIVKNIDVEHSALGILLNDSLSGKQLKTIIDNLEATSIKIQSITQNLDTLSSTMAKDNGALNYLTTDTLLVDQLQSTIQNVEQGVERFNENMEALKHNFLFRGYFRKLEKQEKKEARNKSQD
ncbi:MlaD family protein [uncultured Muriicola sp.]|uniref:MlaD family protein n=1 Tax=uncultured Muriicola sp. TaxID=1583102 RepID=UPI0026322D87|nr:MlaD family protein [uncultured Muriicola sp.]